MLNKTKTVLFRANKVNIEPYGYEGVEVNAGIPNSRELLDNFTPKEIIRDYRMLDDLYEALKEHFA